MSADCPRTPERGQSSMVGIVMLIVVIIVLVSGVAVFLFGITDTTEKSKMVLSPPKVDENGNVVITHQQGKTIKMKHIKIIVVLPDGSKGSIDNLPLSGQQLKDKHVSGEVQFDMRKGAVSKNMMDKTWSAGETIAFRLDEKITEADRVKVMVIDTSTNSVIAEQTSRVKEYGTLDSSVESGDHALYGKIVDADGDPVSNAIVHMSDQTTITNSNGEYEFDNIPSGNHTLYVEPPSSTSFAYTGIVDFELTLDGKIKMHDSSLRAIYSLTSDDYVKDNEIGFKQLQNETIVLSGTGKDMNATVHYENTKNARDAPLNAIQVNMTSHTVRWMNGTDPNRTFEVGGNVPPWNQSVELVFPGENETKYGYHTDVVTNNESMNGTYEKGDSDVSVYVDGNREPRNVTMVFLDNFNSTNKSDQSVVLGGKNETFYVDAGTLSTDNETVTFLGMQTLIDEDVKNGTKANPGSLTVDGNYYSFGNVTFVGQSTTSPDSKSGTIKQSPHRYHHVFPPHKTSGHTGEHYWTSVKFGDAFFDGYYSINVDYRYDKDYQNCCGVSNHFGFGIDGERDHFHPGYWNQGGTGTLTGTNYYSKGENIDMEFMVACDPNAFCSIESEGGLMEGSKPPKRVGEPITIEGNQPSNVTVSVTGKSYGKKTWVTKKYEANSNAYPWDSTPSEDTVRWNLMKAKSAGKYTFDMPWLIRAASTEVYDTCVSGEAYIKVKIARVNERYDDTVLSKSVTDYACDGVDHQKSGTLSKTVSLDKGDRIYIEIYERNSGNAKVSRDNDALYQTVSEDSGQTTITLAGTTKTIDYLSAGETKNVTFTNVSTGSHTVYFKPNKGEKVDYEIKWNETFITEDPALDLDGDGSVDAYYNGYLSEGETATVSASAMNGTHSVKAVGKGPGYNWTYDYGEYNATEDPVLKAQNGTVVASYNGVLKPGTTYTESFPSVEPESNEEFYVEVKNAPVDANLTWTYRNGVDSPDAYLNGDQICSYTGVVKSNVTCQVPNGTLTTKSNTLSFKVEEGHLKWKFNYTERAQAEEVTVTLPNGTSILYPDDFNSDGLRNISAMDNGTNTFSADTPKVNNMNTSVNVSIEFTNVTKPEGVTIYMINGNGTRHDIKVPDSAINEDGVMTSDWSFTIPRDWWAQGDNTIYVETETGKITVKIKVNAAGGWTSADNFG